jgi:hypothetical protein
MDTISLPVPQQPVHLRFNAHQVALMAQIANVFSAGFARKVNPGLDQAFIGRYLETLVSDESPNIPRTLARALNLKQNGAVFTWTPPA